MIEFELVWFDSLGAKSSCTLVKTPDVSILIDPGIAAMQASFPASSSKKLLWKLEGKRSIERASKKADVIVVSHYHHDHYFPEDLSIYKNKIIFIKNPNEYINDSQRDRAEKFFSKVCEEFGKTSLENFLEKPEMKNYGEPLKDIPAAVSKDFGDYNDRRRYLLKQGMEWFRKRENKWKNYDRIPELNFGRTRFIYPEGKIFSFGETKVRFTKPLFHGIEFSRVGWIFATIIEYKGSKFIHSSDVNGPIIEDYADFFIRENPDVLILDGPMTYMLGYLLNKTNLRRAIANATRIVKKTDTRLIIYDHHLPREARFRENTIDVWKEAKKEGKDVLTAAEYLGKTPKVLECVEG